MSRLKNRLNSLQSYYIKCDVNLFQTSCEGTKKITIKVNIYKIFQNKKSLKQGWGHEKTKSKLKKRNFLKTSTIMRGS